MRRPTWKISGALLALFITSVPGKTGAQATNAVRSLYNAADVQFVQGMMAHHAQAIVMSALVTSHTTRGDIRTAARRIIVSQRDEIALMRRWLERRGQQVPMVDTTPIGTQPKPMPGMSMPGMANDDGHQMLMPGMLTPERLSELANANGAKFDSLFLRFMIGHHEGALTMVSKLFATSGATQESEIFQLASEIDSDQSAEIARMQAMQSAKALPKKRLRS